MAIRFDAHRDEFHRDQQWHKPVRVATTADVTISTALNAGDTIDGVTLAAGDRVLVKDQGTGSQNGIYIVSASPARAYDMLTGIQAWGAFVYVIAGTANAGTLWYNTNATLPTIGSTSLTFTEFVSSTIVLSDDTPLVDADDGDPGVSTEASHSDHVHPDTGAVGELLISDTPSTPLVFADLVQNEAQDDLVYADLGS